MILIADSGSTKTDWRLVNKNGDILPFETIGFNPYFISSASILNELDASNLSTIKEKVSQVYFYAAGCSTDTNRKLISEPLCKFFKNANIEVEHDLLAAARATCGYNSGMAAILGTGSNSCLFNGKEIVENVAALGFILGDLGSGADIGKALIKAYLAEELPKEIMDDFKLKYNLSIADILDAVYKNTLPNRFLAGFSLFVFQHINNKEVKQLVEERFNLFFEKNICKYSNYKQQQLHLVGSIAFIYQDLLKEVANRFDLELGKIIKQPIDELVKFHLGNN